MPAELIRKYYPEYTGKRHDTRIQKILADLLGLYYKPYHQLEIKLHPDSPKTGPALILMGHLSILEGAAIVGDPYRFRTIPVVNQKMYDTPVIGWALRQWGTIPVRKDGRDIGAVRKILNRFSEGRVVCIAPAGRMSETGILGPLQPTAVELALRASLEMPVFPMAVVGAYEALPPGAWFPRRRKLTLVTGRPINLDDYNSKSPRHDQLEEAALIIQTAIANLYPRRNRPLPGTPALARLAPYIR